MRYALVVLAAPFVLCLAGCPGKGVPIGPETDDPEPTASVEPTSSAEETPSADPLSVSFSSLTYNHEFGVSPCPQPIGTILVTNNTATEAAVTVALSDLVGLYPVQFNPAATTVPAGGTATVVVEFNCGSTDDYTVGVNVTVTNGTDTVTESATITGTVTGEP
jgi:hypothetical protein